MRWRVKDMTDERNSVTVELTKAKETKGTWMYLAADDDPVGNLYFKKSALDRIGQAERIRVTIEKLR
jgi:hypothetical protein